jgi:hypothetical protein
MSKKCHCGQDLHYNDPNVENEVRQLIEKMGEFIKVTVGNKTFKISRHYIALHGLKAEHIDKLGFEEV